MDRNTNAYFENTSNIEIKRSGFDLSHTVTTTFDTGDLIPLGDPMEVLPGDTFDLGISAVIRMTTPIFPVLDNSYADIFAFFVPNRIVYDHWEEEMGENKQTAWEPQTEYTTPQIEAPSGGWTEGTLADYYGLPTKVGNISVSALPFRGYAAIWSEWFRDQTRKDPAMIHKDETTRTGTNLGTDYVNQIELGGLPAKVAKFHDRFTSSTPSRQRGPDVFLPLGGTTGKRPVFTGEGIPGEFTQNKMPLHWVTANPSDSMPSGGLVSVPYASSGNNYASHYLKVGSISGSGTSVSSVPSNLWADLAYTSGGIDHNSTINQLRQAFAVQSFYERLAVGGSRYTEIIRSLFSVSSPDARLQRPELIGSQRVAININAVLQTSSTDSTSPQGNVAANSVTAFFDADMGIYSRTEHGMIHYLVCVRTDRTYQQGIARLWSRKTMLDHYNPMFSNIGEMPILNKEIYAQGTTVTDANGDIVDDQVFGFQDAWDEYRTIPNKVTGLMRSNATGSLDTWHYGDYYTQLPIGVSGDWIDEPKTNMARTLAVQNEPQFFGAFHIIAKAYRPMPVRSIPFNMRYI